LANTSSNSLFGISRANQFAVRRGCGNAHRIVRRGTGDNRHKLPGFDSSDRRQFKTVLTWPCPLSPANASLPLNGHEGLLLGNALFGKYFIDDGSSDFPPVDSVTDRLTLTNIVSYSMGSDRACEPTAKKYRPYPQPRSERRPFCHSYTRNGVSKTPRHESKATF
jgi:hypothetical protein